VRRSHRPTPRRRARHHPLGRSDLASTPCPSVGAGAPRCCDHVARCPSLVGRSPGRWDPSQCRPGRSNAREHEDCPSPLGGDPSRRWYARGGEQNVPPEKPIGRVEVEHWTRVMARPLCAVPDRPFWDRERIGVASAYAAFNGPPQALPRSRSTGLEDRRGEVVGPGARALARGGPRSLRTDVGDSRDSPRRIAHGFSGPKLLTARVHSRHTPVGAASAPNPGWPILSVGDPRGKGGHTLGRGRAIRPVSDRRSVGC
jgi:hypothetical protein